MKRWIAVAALMFGGCAAMTPAEPGTDAGSEAAIDGAALACPATYDSDACTMTTDTQNCMVDVATGQRTCTTTSTTVALRLGGYACVRPIGTAGVDFVVGCTAQVGRAVTITVPLCSVCSAS